MKVNATVVHRPSSCGVLSEHDVEKGEQEVPKVNRNFTHGWRSSGHQWRFLGVGLLVGLCALWWISPLLAAFFDENTGFYPQWKAMRVHLGELTDPAVARIRSDLYFYDLSMEYVLSWRGLGWILWSHLASAGQLSLSTETNHAMQMWYFQPYVRGDPRFRNPTKWNFRALESSPFPKEMMKESVEILRSHAAEIKEEYKTAVRQQLTAHPDQRTEVAKGGHWDWNFLYGTTGKNSGVCARVPATTKVVHELPTTYNYGFVFFSRLKPHTHITPHTGSTNLRIRLHLGIEIPHESNYTATIRVGTEEQAWVQDDVLVFDDSFEHEVVYEGTTERAILIIDLWHPQITERERELLSWPKFGPFGVMGKNVRVLD